MKNGLTLAFCCLAAVACTCVTEEPALAPDASASRYAKPVAILYLGAGATPSPSEYLSLLLSGAPRASRVEASVEAVIATGRSLREHLADSATGTLLDGDLDLVFLEESVANLSNPNSSLNADISAIAARVRAQRPCARIVVVAPYVGDTNTRTQITARARAEARSVDGLWLPVADVGTELGTVSAGSQLSAYTLAASMFRMISGSSPPNAAVVEIMQPDAARVRAACDAVWSRAPSDAVNFDFAEGAARAPYWCSLACNALPNVRMVSSDLNICANTTPSPSANEVYFSSTCGCGYTR